MKTRKNVGRCIFSLIFCAVCTLIFASGEAQAVPPGPRCTNLNFAIDFAIKEPLDITGMPLGSELPSFDITVHDGQCIGNYIPAHHAGGFIIVQSHRTSGSFIPQNKQKSQISIADDEGKIGLLTFATADGLGYTPVRPGVQPFILERKRPGLTEISINDILGKHIQSNILSSYNFFEINNASEKAIVSVSGNTLQLIYRPTCSASVNNVDFGNLNVSDIINGVTKQAYVDIDCNDLLLAYSIKVTSGNGSDDNGIFSENDTVGYRLTWGDLKNTGLESSLSGKAIELNNELDNKSDPKYTRFSIPINITPVSRLSFGNDIKPGKADSVINIELKFK
ncbi:MAG: hypothetical protein ACRDB3_17465 [Citrobacter telavivensis]